VVRLSAAPIDWGISRPDDEDPSPEEILDCVAAAGYAGCELGTHGFFGLTPDEILSRFEERGLAVTASWYDIDLARPLSDESAEEIDLICSFLQAGGASILNISDKITDDRLEFVARVPQFPDTWWGDEEWEQVPRTLLQVHAVTSQRGVAVALHPHVGSHIETASEVRQALRATEGTAIAICLDTGHLVLGGSDPVAVAREHGERIAHVHAKDVDEAMFAEVKAGRIDYLSATGKGLYSDLGAGLVDWQGVKQALDAVDYQGWVVSEQDRLLVPGSRIPFDACGRNYRFLAELFDV
jgi:inosose dehydratase